MYRAWAFSNFAISKITVVELSNGTPDKFSFITDFDSVEVFFSLLIVCIFLFSINRSR